MKDEDGFVQAMDKVFEKFSEELATLRVYFRVDDAVISADTHVMGGRLFKPESIKCAFDQLPSFITDKIALLRAAGRGVVIEDVGVWKRDSDGRMYYVKATPKQWNEYAKRMK